MILPIINNTVTPISGGTITLNGTKIVHTFLTNGALIVPPGLKGNIEILVIGGGGAGGNYAGGGGGAGEDVYVASHAISGQTYTVTVGDGGVGNRGTGVWNSWADVSHALNGEDSIFDTLTAHGGGGGGATRNTPNSIGNDGACGGGGAWRDVPSYAVTNGGTGTYGNNGGNGYMSDGYSNSGGGGGGQSAAGANAGSGAGGNGGAGVAYSISGASVNYCGGGGGGVNKSDGTPGTASYGGGAGSKTGNGSAGTDGTGGGGGGAYGSSSGGYYGGDGGSGIVIISYSLADLGIYFFSLKRTFIPFRGTSRFLNYTI